MAEDGKNKPAGPRYNSGNTPGVRTSKNTTDLALIKLKALEMRIQGRTFYDIAKELRVNYETARDYVANELKKTRSELVPQLRAVEDARLDTVVAECHRIMAKHPGTELALKAADRLLRAVTARANLHGLNAPVEVSITEHTKLDQDIADLLRQQEALNEATRSKIVDGELVGETNGTDPAALA